MRADTGTIVASASIYHQVVIHLGRCHVAQGNPGNAEADASSEYARQAPRADARFAGREFLDRDVVLGLIVTEGTSTLDGHVVDASQAHTMLSEFGIGANAFSAVLIGKDGGVKLRINEVPDVPAIYAVIDGMPMRNAEMRADPGRC